MTAYLSWLRNGRTVEHALVLGDDGQQAATLESRLADMVSFYRWQAAVHGVPVAIRLLRGAPRSSPGRAMLSHLDAGSAPAASSLVRVRRAAGGERDADR